MNDGEVERQRGSGFKVVAWGLCGITEAVSGYPTTVVSRLQVGSRRETYLPAAVYIAMLGIVSEK